MGYAMNKKYIVRLNDEERRELITVITKLKGTSQKVKRAQILLKADDDGPNWPHHPIAEAFLCRTKTVSNVCKSLVERGFDIAAAYPEELAKRSGPDDQRQSFMS